MSTNRKQRVWHTAQAVLLCLGLTACQTAGPGVPATDDTSAGIQANDRTSSFTFTGVGDNLLHDTLFVYHEQDTGAGPGVPATDDTSAGIQANDRTSSFTFTGVGDNLLHDTLFVYHEQDTGNRDYSGMYSEVTPYFQNSDIAYINFETPCAGDAFGLSGYPSFNGPLEMIDTLAGMGLNWFSTSSNHSMDAGADGLLAEMAYINEKYPGIFYTGTYPDAGSQTMPAVMDVNGIKVGLASFTYGLNGYTLPEDKPWLVNVFVKNEETGEVDYALMDKILDPLTAASDVQIVSMHWGVEYQNQPSDMQKQVAAYLHKKGVEAVIGSHPHVIQPAELLESEDQQTLVYYSLGNFISGQDQNELHNGGRHGAVHNRLRF